MRALALRRAVFTFEPLDPARSPAPSNEDARGVILSNLFEAVEARSFRTIGVKEIWGDEVTKDVAPLIDKIREIPVE